MTDTHSFLHRVRARVCELMGGLISNNVFEARALRTSTYRLSMVLTCLFICYDVLAGTFTLTKSNLKHAT